MEENGKVQNSNRLLTKSDSWKKGIEGMVSHDAKKKVDSILVDVEKFTELEKLFLYLKLPTGEPEDYVSRDSRSGTPTMTVTRAEQTHAFNWIRSHLEESPSTSLPKHEVYEDYRAFCESSNHSVLSAADFGKIIKCVFPNIKARRLGTRGNSKYCYSGIRKKAEIKPPSLPNLDLTDQDMADSGLNCVCNCNHHPSGNQEEDQTMSAASFLVCEWAQKLLGRAFDTLLDLARYLVGSNCVSTKSMAAFTVLADMEISSRSSSKSIDLGLIRRPSLVPPHQEARRQLQRKIQERKILKFQKEMSEHKSNAETNSKLKGQPNSAEKDKAGKAASHAKEAVEQDADKASQIDSRNTTFKPIDKQTPASLAATRSTTEVVNVKPTNTTTQSASPTSGAPRSQLSVATSVSVSATCHVTVLTGPDNSTKVTYTPTTSAAERFSEIPRSKEGTVPQDVTRSTVPPPPPVQPLMPTTLPSPGVANQLRNPPAVASSANSGKFPKMPYPLAPIAPKQQPYCGSDVTSAKQQRTDSYRIESATTAAAPPSAATQAPNKSSKESTMSTMSSHGIDSPDGVVAATPFTSPPTSSQNSAKQGSSGSVLMAALSSRNMDNLPMGSLPPISTVCPRISMDITNNMVGTSGTNQTSANMINSNIGLWSESGGQMPQNMGYAVSLSSTHMTASNVPQGAVQSTARNFLGPTSSAPSQNACTSSVSMETASSNNIMSASPAPASLMSPSQPDGILAGSPVPSARSNVGLMHMVSPSPSTLRRPSVGSTPSTTPLPAGSVPSSPLEHSSNSGNQFGFTPIQSGSGFGTTNVTVNNLSPIKPTQRVPATCTVGMPSQTQATGATRRNTLSQQRQQSYPYSTNRTGASSNRMQQMGAAQFGVRNTYLNLSKDSHNGSYSESYATNPSVPVQPRSAHTPAAAPNVNQALTFASPPNQGQMSGYMGGGGTQVAMNACSQDASSYAGQNIPPLGLGASSRSHSAPLPQALPGNNANGQTPWQVDHQNPQNYAAKRNLTQILETDNMETPLRELELSDADFEIDNGAGNNSSLQSGLPPGYGLPQPLTQQYLHGHSTAAYENNMDDVTANTVFQDFYQTPNRNATPGGNPANGVNFDLHQWQVSSDSNNGAQQSMSC